MCDADTIANAHAELLAVERLKDLCKRLGLAIPTELLTYPPVKASEYQPLAPLQFPLHQDMEHELVMEQQQSFEETDVKLDVKPPHWMDMYYLGKKSLLCIIGTGDEDHIITRVIQDSAPL